jgi:hypothetical protein
MAAAPTMSFPLPQGEKVDVHLVRLADGRLVARTSDELEKIPPGQSAQTPAPPRPPR